MERNDNLGGAGQAGATNTGNSIAGGSTTGDFGTTGGSTGGSLGGGGDFGGSSVGSAAGSQGFADTTSGGGGYGATGGTGGDASTGGSKLDAAKEKLSQGRDALGDRLGTVKEKAGQLSATLADRLEAGAEKLRQRGQQGAGQQFAGTDGQTVAANDQMTAVTNRLAGGLQGTADFLRQGDLQGSIEQQVREHPARTLLVAAGLGYLIGKALKK